MCVSTSLYGALEAQEEEEHVALGLCIDQENHDERSEQVRLMTKIYALAQDVAVWLGGEADDSCLGLRFLEDLADEDESQDTSSV